MKSIRKYYATEWIKTQKEYEVMNWSPAPPNPLQHTTIKTTIEKYAELGSNNIWEARKRCYEKYGKTEIEIQPWMKSWQ